MEAINRLVAGYHDLMDNKSDQRVKDWPMMSSPLPTLAICLTYVFVVKYMGQARLLFTGLFNNNFKQAIVENEGEAFAQQLVAGPKFMENRKAYELKQVLIWYNLFQVLFSIWLFNESIASGWFTTHSFQCQPVDYSRSPMAMRTASGCWWYYFSKFTEFFDTIFFVMRKKFDHVSKLHVIHHGIMPMSVWFGVKFTPGGHSTFFGMLNTFVHIIMYSYYLLAALGPKVQKYLWWKKYLTALQMVQFVLVFFHAFQLLFVECDYPRAFVWWIGMHAVLFYYLFSDFYKQAYLRKEKAKIAKAKVAAEAAARSETKDMMYPLLNGFSNGAALGDVRQRVAGAVASQ